MSEQLKEALEDWRVVEKYIQQCPHVSSDHPALLAALAGLFEGRDRQEQELRDRLSAALAWEELATQKRSLDEKPSLFFDTEHLSQEGATGLMKEMTRSENVCADSKKPMTLPHTVQLNTFGAGDLAAQVLPLFVDFLNKSRAQMLEIWTGYNTKYTLQLDENLTMADVPEINESLSRIDLFDKTASFPQLGRLMLSSKCHLTRLSFSDEDHLEPFFVAMLTEIFGVVGKQRLKEIDLSSVRLGQAEIDKLVAALDSCIALERVAIEDSAFLKRKATMAAVERLVNRHTSLQSIQLSVGEDFSSDDSDVRRYAPRDFFGNDDDDSYFDEDDAEQEEEEEDDFPGLWPPLTDSLLSALSNHPSLQTIQIPMDDRHVYSALPLIQHVAQSKTHMSLDLELLSLSKNDDGVTLEIHDNFEEEPEELNKFLLNVPRIPNVTQLVLPFLPSQVLKMFESPDCVVSDLRSDRDLENHEFVQFCKHLENYTRLRKIYLELHLTSPFRGLCPASCLRDVELGISNELVGNGEAQLVRVMAVLFREQASLENFSIHGEGSRHWGFFEEEPESGPSQEELLDFADALGNHGHLQTFSIYLGDPSRGFLDALFGAVAKNSVMESLDVSGLEAELDRIAHYITQFGLVTMIVPSLWGGERLALALKQNTSVRSIMDDFGDRLGDYRDESISPSTLTEVLTRNVLLHRAGKVGDGQQGVPFGLWPAVLSKLGSNNNDGSPVFAFMKKGAGLFLDSARASGTPTRQVKL